MFVPVDEAVGVGVVFPGDVDVDAGALLVDLPPRAPPVVAFLADGRIGDLDPQRVADVRAINLASDSPRSLTGTLDVKVASLDPRRLSGKREESLDVVLGDCLLQVLLLLLHFFVDEIWGLDQKMGVLKFRKKWGFLFKKYRKL